MDYIVPESRGQVSFGSLEDLILADKQIGLLEVFVEKPFLNQPK
jgi:hypothetical protein